MRPRRIGLITTSFPRFEDDLAGCFVLGMARALAARGHRIEVIAPEPPPLRLPEAARSERSRERWAEEGIDLRRMPYLRPRSLQRTFYGAGAPENLGRDPLAWPGLLSAPLCLGLAAKARADRWEAVISHWALPSGLIGGLVRRARPPLPHLMVAHSGELALLSRLPLRGTIAERLAEGASRIAFVSEDHRARFLGWLRPSRREAARAASFVSPMGIEEPRPMDRERARRLLRVEGDRPVLLTLGRLVPIKGIPTAIEAVARIRARIPGLLLVIAGDGPESGSLRRYAASCGAKTLFLGTVTGEKKRAALGAADLFLLPSAPTASGRTEGLPTALIEAMASGLVPVASRTGGVPEQLEDGVEGRLFSPRDAEALAEILVELLGEGGGPLRARMAEAARRRVETLTWPRRISLFEEALFAPVEPARP